MTIIQAQPLKQFGISGPASALDNEVPVFDGVTGKKIKAGTGIICPLSGRLDLAEIRARDGDGLKLYDDGGNGIFIEDGGNVGIGADSPARNLHVSGINTMLRFDRLNDLYGPALLLVSKNASDVVQKSWLMQGQSDQFYIGDWGTAVSGLINESDKRWIIQADGDTIIQGGNVGIGTTDPTAKLDISSDILRLRTAKTPSSAGDTGNQGDECWDADYHYRCVATNTWKRTALTTW